MFFKNKGGKNKPPAIARSPSEVIREQALANVRGARERLGEEYIQEMADILKKHQSKLTPDQAKAKIKATDPDVVAAEILAMLEDKT